MWLTLKIALRNLVRQRRRNLLLAIAIGFGMMILVMTTSFTNGVKDILLNFMMKNAVGHVGVQMTERVDGKKIAIIRDKQYIENIIRKNIPDVEQVMGSMQVFTRVIGNGTGDMMALVAQSRFGNKKFMKYWESQLVSGNISDFTNGRVENPIMIYEPKAKTLKVKAGDTIKVRLRNVYGQVQTASLTVVAIVKGINEMASMAGYVTMPTMQMLNDYKPWEVRSIIVNLSNVTDPLDTKITSDKLHDALKPVPLFLQAQANVNGGKSGTLLVGIDTNAKAQTALKKALKLKAGKIRFEQTGYVLISSALAQKLRAKIGSPISLSYHSKYNGASKALKLRVSGIADFPKKMGENVVMINALDLFERLYTYWPDLAKNKVLLSPKNPLYSALTKPYILLPRTYTMKSYLSKRHRWREKKWSGAILDVRSMQEIAEWLLQLERVVWLIAFIWVAILFVIISIGVGNTMRMSVRERTREIGTMRAIGMQAPMLKRVFLSEAGLLGFFASLGGTILAFILMWLLSLKEMHPQGMMSILLKNGHFHFIPPWDVLFGCLAIIVLITLGAAYFPSRRAAKLSAADALRHFE